MYIPNTYALNAIQNYVKKTKKPLQPLRKLRLFLIRWGLKNYRQSKNYVLNMQSSHKKCTAVCKRKIAYASKFLICNPQQKCGNHHRD